MVDVWQKFSAVRRPRAQEIQILYIQNGRGVDLLSSGPQFLTSPYPTLHHDVLYVTFPLLCCLLTNTELFLALGWDSGVVDFFWICGKLKPHWLAGEFELSLLDTVHVADTLQEHGYLQKSTGSGSPVRARLHLVPDPLNPTFLFAHYGTECLVLLDFGFVSTLFSPVEVGENSSPLVVRVPTWAGLGNTQLCVFSCGFALFSLPMPLLCSLP